LTNIYINYPILSLLISIILIAGVHEVGGQLLKFQKLKNILIEISDLKYQQIFIGGNFLLLFLYPITLFFESKIFLTSVSYILFIFGINFFFNFFLKKKYFFFNKINNFEIILFIIIFISLFLISASPVTNADALDYHMTVAKNIAAHGKYPLDLTHFHARLAGSGEIIIALGLILGAEQFGSIFQFVGFLSLIGILQKRKNSFFYILLLITSPVVLFLVSTPKPQLFNICSIALIFYIFINDAKKNNFLLNKIKVFLGLLILMIATQVKFSFNLSAFLISIIIFIYAFKKNILKEFIIYGIFIFCTVVMPPVIWKYINYQGNIFINLLYPVPINLAGMNNFYGYLTNTGSDKGFLNVIFPQSLGNIANSLGLGVFLFIFLILKKIKNNITIIVIISLFVLISLIFGQINARFFYEPLVWTILSVAYYQNFKQFYSPIIFIFRCQFLIVALICVYSAFLLFKGSITKELRDKMMLSNASGYGLFKWVNEVLPSDAAIISYHRSIFLSKTKAISVDLLSYSIDIKQNYINDKNQTALLYWQEIYRIKPKYLVTYGYNKSQNINKIENCLGELFKEKLAIGSLESRNPFNKPSQKYNGYIYKIDYKKFPECLYPSIKIK